ncbi:MULTISPECIES: hypothetical protein [Marinobacter]|uniref:hypothetical protein n=1 Tax=Marinobacter TaxID=2742 RepID=UPI002ABE1412|nr:hypothetical protein [Marinobacter alexandrii]
MTDIRSFIQALQLSKSSSHLPANFGWFRLSKALANFWGVLRKRTVVRLVALLWVWRGFVLAQTLAAIAPL